MKVTSKISLYLGRRLPRGYWPILRRAALRDPALQNLPVSLKFVPGRAISADLRESVFVPFVRHGSFPHQEGEDILFIRLLKQGDIVIDVGANIGYTSLLFASLVEPSGRVIAVEPSPRAFRYLQASTHTDGLIECINVGLSDHRGMADFFEAPALDLSSIEPIDNQKPISIPVCTLDEIIAERGGKVDFVKIDVEGHEAAVIRGMGQALASPKPPVVVFEALTDERLIEILAAFESLTDAPYQVLRINARGGLVDVTSENGTKNFLFLPTTQTWRIANTTA